MHGRPRQPKGVPEDPEKARAAQQRVRERQGGARATTRASVDAAKRADAAQPHTPPPHQLSLFGRLCDEVLRRRAAGRTDAESVTLAGKLLEQNPEVYTAWNLRRDALTPVLQVCTAGRP